MNKKILIIPLMLTIVMASGYLITKGYAEENSDILPPFLQRLAKKFNLNENEVKTFVDEDRQVRRQEMQETRTQEITNKLNDLVASNKISESQKEELLSIFNSHLTSMEQNGNKSKEEIQNIMQDHRIELENWAKENNLDLSNLDLEFFKQGGNRMGSKKGTGYGERGAVKQGQIAE